MRKVLQVNIRLSEGGAAGVARTLADELRRLDIQSPFAYGYGKGGGPSPLEEQYAGVRVTPRAIAALNRLSYGVRGKETTLASPRLWAQFQDEINSSDLVHLHAVHSYFVSTERLFDALVAAGKPVVWTLHDQWIMTGRCAQPGDCRRWESGCKSCPNLEAYPPAIYDRAAERWHERYAAVRNLQDKLPTAIVACAEWLGDEAQKAGIQNVQVIKNSVDREYWDAVKAARKQTGPFTKNIFMCRDLRDNLKVNWQVLNRISEIEGQSLTIIGDNPHDIPALASHHNAIMNRTKLAQVVADHDRLIFTSRVDYFPLTIAEALTAGLSILAIDSRAAREFRNHPRVILANDEDHLVKLAAENNAATISDEDVDDGRAFFDPKRMAREYLAIYERLVTSS